MRISLHPRLMNIQMRMSLHPHPMENMKTKIVKTKTKLGNTETKLENTETKLGKTKTTLCSEHNSNKECPLWTRLRLTHSPDWVVSSQEFLPSRSGSRRTPWRCSETGPGKPG